MKTLAFNRDTGSVEFFGLPIMGGWLPRVQFLTLPCCPATHEVDWGVFEELLNAPSGIPPLGAFVTVEGDEDQPTYIVRMRCVLLLDWACQTKELFSYSKRQQ